MIPPSVVRAKFELDDYVFISWPSLSGNGWDVWCSREYVKINVSFEVAYAAALELVEHEP